MSKKPTQNIGYNKDILCIIPARAGSKRVKNKNTRLLNCTPLICYSIDTAIKAGFDPIIVSTNSKEIANISINYYLNINILFRSNNISSDSSTDQDVINHAVERLKIPRGRVIAYLRPTTPFRDLEVVKLACARFVTQKEFSSLRCVEELTESSYKTYILNNSRLLPAFKGIKDANLPNQLYPKTYRNNGYLDLYRCNIKDIKPMGYVTPKTIEIDTEDDLVYAEWHISRQYDR